MTAAVEPTGTHNKKLDQSYIDQVLSQLKGKIGTVADEVVEERYKQLNETIEKKLDEGVKSFGQRARKFDKQQENAKRSFGVLCHAVLRSKGRPEKVIEIAEEELGEYVAAELEESQKKTLSLQDATSGGILVQGDTLDRFFDVLRPSVAVLALNPVEVPMPSRSIQITGLTGDMTSSYVGEPNTSEVKSEPTSGSRSLSAKTQMTLVPVSNQLIDSPPGPRITRFIENAARRRMAVRQDSALITGAGTSFEPQGLRNWAGNTGATAGQSLANVFTDFENAINTLESNNVDISRGGVIFAPRSKNHLMFGALDADNKPFFLEEMRGGTVLGFPFRATTNVPTNLGGGSNESYVLFADFDQVLYGTVGALRVEYFAEGSYTESGTLVSAMERNEQVLRLIDEHDLNVEHTEAVFAITGVLWGT